MAGRTVSASGRAVSRLRAGESGEQKGRVEVANQLPEECRPVSWRKEKGKDCYVRRRLFWRRWEKKKNSHELAVYRSSCAKRPDSQTNLNPPHLNLTPPPCSGPEPCTWDRVAA